MQAEPDIGVLLIHGFLGSPREWEMLQGMLNESGYKTRSITHLGHGADPQRKLKDIRADQILDFCLAEYGKFSAQCDRVYVIGHSLGGLAALWISAKCPEKLSGALVFSAPFQCAYWVNHFSGLLRYPIKHLLPALRFAPDFFTGYERPYLSPRWARELQRQASDIFARVREVLPRIETPVWLVHSPYDLAVPFDEMEQIANRIGKPHLVKTHTVDQCGHQVFMSKRRYNEPYELVSKFLITMEGG